MHPIRSSLGAACGWVRPARPQRRHLRADLVAGPPGAISSVPDGMAAAVLAGVNPVQGLYASFAGPIAGGLTSDTQLMVITTTSAAALAAGSALHSVPAAQRPGAVPLLAVMAGVALVAAGMAGLGRYTRFVSYSVIIGFLTGISITILCGQIPGWKPGRSRARVRGHLHCWGVDRGRPPGRGSVADQVPGPDG